MTRVDFYLTHAAQPRQTLVTACRLADKASAQGHHVFIHTDDPSRAQQLDEMLWTFRQGSFIPHAIIDTNAKPNPHDKVLIGYGHNPECTHDILINLAAEIPDFFSRFSRVAEIVSSNDEQRSQARQRFRFYRDRGYELHSHELVT